MEGRAVREVEVVGRSSIVKFCRVLALRSFGAQTSRPSLLRRAGRMASFSWCRCREVASTLRWTLQLGLEAEDYAAFAAEVSPFVLRNPLEERKAVQTGDRIEGGRVGAGAIERLFECERDPLVEFVVKRADAHVATRA